LYAPVIYLDSNATTRVAPEVVTAMLPLLEEQWVNPSASYAAARGVRRAVERAREQVASLIVARADEVVFTSCGTESINAVHDSVRALWPERRGLIIGATEHAAVLGSAARWRETGGRVDVVPVDAGGRVDLTALETILAGGDTALVSIMWANNETGVLAPMPEIVALAHAAGAQVHTDAVQLVGKCPINVEAVGVDYLSLSGHKMHAAKGVGTLFVSRRMRFRPLIIGGGQENGRRSGTENVAGIVGLGVAAELMGQALAAGEEQRVGALRDDFEQRITQTLPEVRINGHLQHRLPTTSSLTFPGLDSAGLLILLDKAGVACSAGSACHTGALHPSTVLEAMGLDRDHAASTLRFSFSRFNTAEESEQAARHVVAAVEKMRRL
jgi:cysteine desulfurase